MGCGRDQTIGMPTPPGAVGRDLFLSRPQEEQKTIQEEMKIISQPVCQRQNQSSCANYNDYLGAWKRLAEVSPFVGYKLLMQNQFEWPDEFSWHASKKNEAGIEKGLWNQALAFKWIFANVPESKQFSFLEEVVTDSSERHPFIFVVLADYLLYNRTPERMGSVENVRNNVKNLLDSGAQVFDEKLGWQIRRTLSDIEFRQILSRPVSPQISK